MLQPSGEVLQSWWKLCWWNNESYADFMIWRTGTRATRSSCPKKTPPRRTLLSLMMASSSVFVIVHHLFVTSFFSLEFFDLWVSSRLLWPLPARLHLALPRPGRPCPGHNWEQQIKTNSDDDDDDNDDNPNEMSGGESGMMKNVDQSCWLFSQDWGAALNYATWAQHWTAVTHARVSSMDDDKADFSNVMFAVIRGLFPRYYRCSSGPFGQFVGESITDDDFGEAAKNSLERLNVDYRAFNDKGVSREISVHIIMKVWKENFPTNDRDRVLTRNEEVEKQTTWIMKWMMMEQKTNSISIRNHALSCMIFCTRRGRRIAEACWPQSKRSIISKWPTGRSLIDASEHPGPVFVCDRVTDSRCRRVIPATSVFGVEEFDVRVCACFFSFSLFFRFE